jgi:hypothetical protein
MLINRRRYLLFFLSLLAAITVSSATAAPQDPPEKKVPPVPGPMLADGTISLHTPDFTLTLVRSSQTIAALKTNSNQPFDFTPGDLLVERSKDGYYHLGDIDLRLRVGTSGDWKSYSTALARTPVLALSPSGKILAAADLSPTLPSEISLRVTRAWLIEDGKLVLRFTLENKSKNSIQIGSLGIPMIFNNILNERSLEAAHAKCVFYDPYVGQDAGYLQVTRLSGDGPALVVVPDGKTPFEAYNPILGNRRSEKAPVIFHDPTPRGVTFEGFYEWMVHSQAFGEDEWKKASPWNPPTSLTLAPGESKSYGVRFLLADSIRKIDTTLASNARPVAVGVPGYVVPMDLDAKLFLKYPKPVKSVAVEPAGSIAVEDALSASKSWKAYTLHGKSWGRARLLITYADGCMQAIHYFVTKPESQIVADMGRFLTTKQWFVDPNDPFHRSPSVMSYDRETNQIVTQDSRAWISGLGDEGGSGSWLASAMKEFGQPDKQELRKYEQFVDEVLWGGLQYKDGPKKFGVRKSLFFYQPNQLAANYYRPDLDWTTWTSWNKEATEKIDRSYNYPHVAAAYWSLYRLARNNLGLVTHHSWDWYLNQAYETSIAMTSESVGYSEFGQMEGDIFVQILEDLKREGKTTEATNLEAKMRARAERWRAEPYPFGSEMPWDSTGQEEVYAWMKYFGFQDKADITLSAILGYDPTIPHWGYNGSARRYWDFLYGGKYSRIERQLHHYGSGINAIPVLAAYRERPDDFYLLRVGYGGAMGSLTNIDEDGFASAAFHSFPDMLKFDPLSGDYGPNFFGHAMITATYLVHHSEFGWVAFGGNVQRRGESVSVRPRDSFRNRVYVAPLGLWLTLDAGTFETVEYDSKNGTVRAEFSPSTQFNSAARLRIEQPAKLPGVAVFAPVDSFPLERGAYTVPLRRESTWIELAPTKP